MKECKSCKQLKSLEDFHKQTRSKDGKQSRCKNCNKEQRKAYYKTASGRDKNIMAGRRWQTQTRRKIYEYLLNHPCVDCGETDPVVLEFDHRDASEKEFSISQYVHKYGFDRLMIEIQKCDVRCANCHRRRTAIQFGWHKASWSNGPLA